MSKEKRKAAITPKEEAQARKVIKIIGIALIILALVMIVAFSYWG